jgi:hypothetical protein
MEKEKEISEKVENQNSTSSPEDMDVKKSDNEVVEENEHHTEEAHEDDDHDHDHQAVDYSNYSKSQLVEALNGLLNNPDLIKAEKDFRAIKEVFDHIKEAERAEAHKKFIKEGGAEEDFDFHEEPVNLKIDAAIKAFRDKKAKFNKDREKEREENLVKKNHVLEKLRALVDDEESGASMGALKEIQKEWKSVGQVPSQYNKNLWASYNALIDRFYDKRSIYFELKELDLRKNLEAKLEICERAEKLHRIENVKDAIKELNELHEEFKHLGPVPKDEQENVWQRFKTASDKVYERRKSYVDTIKTELQGNMVSKRQLAEKTQEFAQFDSEKISDWNKKTKDLAEIQQKWELIGGMPKEAGKEINKYFWSAFKAFYNNKNNFFKKLEEKRVDNLHKKQELVKRAKELMESSDWESTAEEYKKLQGDWKNIGPVPERYKDSIYAEFKQACDYFFDRRRSINNEVEKGYQENLKMKEDICEKIEKLADEKSIDTDQLEQLQYEFSQIGFVPKNKIKTIQKRYSSAIAKFVEQAKGLDQDERTKLKVAAEINQLKGEPRGNQKIYKKEAVIRKRISSLENDISIWKNNLEFFANSKTADKLKVEFNKKIEEANKEISELKEQLNVIRSM